MWLKLICYQCNIESCVYKMFYVSHCGNKNVKTYSRLTKSKEKKIKARHYPKSSVHCSNCWTQQSNCLGLYSIVQDQPQRTLLSQNKRLFSLFVMTSQRTLSAPHLLPYIIQMMQLYFFNCKFSSGDIPMWLELKNCQMIIIPVPCILCWVWLRLNKKAHVSVLWFVLCIIRDRDLQSSLWCIW